MRATLARGALAALLWLAPLLASAESWNAAEVAEAEKLRAAQAARAAAYRESVARGEIRSATAPMAREAPQRPAVSPGDVLRDVADIVDSIQRWLGRSVADDGAATPPSDPRRDELRRRARERRQSDAGAE